MESKQSTNKSHTPLIINSTAANKETCVVDLMLNTVYAVV